MSAGVRDNVWREDGTTPDEIEAALARLLFERHAENSAYAPARVLNLVCVVDRQWSGEIANRLRGVGRFHASRTIICAVEPGRTTLDATASVTGAVDPGPGELAAIRETVVVTMGPSHLQALETIVGPLVVTDLPTVAWAPHGHTDAVDALLPLSQVVLLDSVDGPEPGEALARASALAERAYVVDLAWLRSTPWRERIAATFDPDWLRPELGRISSVEVRHHSDSAASGLLLVGWLASRLGWQPARLLPRGRGLTGRLHARRQDVDVALEPGEVGVRGLGGISVETAFGTVVSLDRGDGGLRARRRSRDGSEETWTVLGASRGEGGILGEGIRQALLRDQTYRPALDAARGLIA